MSSTHAEIQLLPKDRTILEREVMEFRPFGLDEQGHTIRDLSGMSIRAAVVHLDKSLSRERGAAAGRQGAGALLEAYGARESGRAMRIQGERARVAHEFEAWQADEQAAAAIAIGQRQAAEERRKGRLSASRALAVAAASGAGVSDPTIVNLLARNEGEATYRANIAMYEAEARSRTLRLDAAAGRVTGADALTEGRSRELGQTYTGLGRLAATGASLYAKYGGKGPGSGDEALIYPQYDAAVGGV